jgi:hypothetical protein
MNIDSLWREIAEEQSHAATPGIAVRRINPECPDDIFVGYKQPQGTKLLILRLPSAPVLAPNALVQSRGFTNHLSRYQHDPAGSQSLVLEANDPLFNSVFSILAADIIRRISDRRPEDTPVSAFLGCLLHWKRFFDLSGYAGLSEELLLGLFAELSFLHDFAMRGIKNRGAAVAGWVGPDPLSKDFQYPGFAVEVKGTASAEPVMVRISNERQLDDSGIDVLLLFVLSTEKAAGTGGTTVPELVEKIRNDLGTTSARLTFEEKLISYGYHDVHRDRYESRRFIAHGHRAFHVREGFPRLTANIPQGVGDVTYSLTLSACTSFAVSDKKITELFSSVPSYDA